MNCPKRGCTGTLERTNYNGVPLNVCDTCGDAWPAIAGSATPRKAATKGKSHYANVPTECGKRHRHASKTEAAVCGALHAEYEAQEGNGFFSIIQQPCFPLLIIATRENDRPLYFTPDFVVWSSGRMLRVIDAKSGRRRNREWARGKAAFEATYGIKVEEVDR